MNYTTIEESKQLIEAGLDVNTADMLYLCYKFTYTKYGYTDISYHPIFKSEKDFYTSTNDKLDLPCWSLKALLNIIDNNSLIYDITNDKNRDFEILVYSVNYIKQGLEFHHTEHTIVDMVVWLLEHGYIKNKK